MMVAIIFWGVGGGGSSWWPTGFLLMALGLSCPVQLVEFGYLHPPPPHPTPPHPTPATQGLNLCPLHWKTDS